MQRSEYEQRKKILDDQLRTALDLVHAGHRAQLQMLEMLWRTSGGEAEEAPETPALSDPPAAVASRPSSSKIRRLSGEVYDEVVAVLPQLPEEFTKNDVHCCLGYSLDRVSLFRVLRALEDKGRIERKSQGVGRQPTVYLKKHNGAIQDGGGAS